MDRIILYARKATKSQGPQPQIAEQIRQMMEYAKEKQLKVVATFSEELPARQPFTRPEFAKMIGMLERGDGDTILCEDFTRLTRNMVEANILVRLLTNGKLKSIQTNYHLYTSNSLNPTNCFYDQIHTLCSQEPGRRGATATIY